MSSRGALKKFPSMISCWRSKVSAFISAATSKAGVADASSKSGAKSVLIWSKAKSYTLNQLATKNPTEMYYI